MQKPKKEEEKKLKKQFTPYTKINWMNKKLKYKSWNIIVLDEYIENKISDIPRSNTFANISPTARELKEKHF